MSLFPILYFNATNREISTSNYFEMQVSRKTNSWNFHNTTD